MAHQVKATVTWSLGQFGHQGSKPVEPKLSRLKKEAPYEKEGRKRKERKRKAENDLCTSQNLKQKSKAV
jgi:hypothetical protein